MEVNKLKSINLTELEKLGRNAIIENSWKVFGWKNTMKNQPAISILEGSEFVVIFHNNEFIWIPISVFNTIKETS